MLKAKKMIKLMIFQKIYGQIMKTRQQFKLFQRKIQKKNKMIKFLIFLVIKQILKNIFKTMSLLKFYLN